MISYGKCTKAQYEALTPVQDRIYYITDTGEQFLNGLPYDGEDNRDYLCLTAETDGATVQLRKQGNNTASLPDINLEYSTDKRNWTRYTWNGSSTTVITLAHVGDKVYFRGDNTTFSYPSGVSAFYNFHIVGTANPSGNIMSLIDHTCEALRIPDTGGRFFYSLFSVPTTSDGTMTDISGLRLPATELAEYCYGSMFVGQKALINGVVSLPATTMKANCYRGMFQECTALLYPPELPATVLATRCYSNMFQFCSALPRAPRLPARTLADRCYEQMFRNDPLLAEIEVGFDVWGTQPNTLNWTDQGVAATGVFRCPSTLDTTTRDASHIPSGWSVIYTDVEASKTIPSATSSDAGKVLTVNASGTPAWADAQGGGGSDEDTLEALDDTITMLTSIVGELSDKSYFHVTALEPSIVSFRGGDYNYNDSNTFEYSYDRREWFKALSLPLTVSLDTGEVLWLRNAREAIGWDFVNESILSGTGGVTVGGELLSLASKSVDHTKVFSDGGRRLHYLFYEWTALKGIEPGLNLSINGFDGLFDGAFRVTGLTEIPDNFAFPEGVTSVSDLFGGCSSLTSVGDGFIIPNTVTNTSNMFNKCSALASIGDGFTIPSSVTSMGNMLYRLNLTTIGNNVSINPGANNTGHLDKDKITSIGTGFDYMSSYTTSDSSGQAVFPNATIGNGWKIYQYSDL